MYFYFRFKSFSEKCGSTFPNSKELINVHKSNIKEMKSYILSNGILNGTFRCWWLWGLVRKYFITIMILKFITSRNIMILFPSFLNLLIPICHEKYSWCLHEIWYDFHIFSKCEISDISYEFWWFRLKHFFRSLYDKNSH